MTTERVVLAKGGAVEMAVTGTAAVLLWRQALRGELRGWRRWLPWVASAAFGLSTYATVTG